MSGPCLDVDAAALASTDRAMNDDHSVANLDEFLGDNPDSSQDSSHRSE